ncbi:MAG: aspartate--tRNA(Asn) ligase [Microgenomates group bacterium]|jgi:nondiscriminating aspartyl-tRNA synthetase|nr:aspartate--tRNA(Asn) ligase [Candidatus Woesebacteria bacterium]MBP6882794.1 aspartate--tRNA(Asn) ligase [Candidatus Woesebacteria bacterium]
MKQLLLTDLSQHLDEEVVLHGWVNTVRDHKKIVFLDLRDATGMVQVVADEKASTLSPEDVVEIKGLVKKRPDKLVNDKVVNGSIEVEARGITLISKAHTLPFDMGKEELGLTLPVLLDNRSLTLRHPTVQKIFKVQEAVAEGFRRTAKELGCTEIFVPTIAASSTEGGAEVFEVKYYEHKATLTQSPQLYKQMLIPAFERVYTISHAYRSEPSVTTRHLAETIQMDCEFGFVNFEDLLDLLEKVCVGMIKYAEETHKDIVQSFTKRAVLYGKIPRLTLAEAQEIIKKEFNRTVTDTKDLSPEDEQDICKWAREKQSSDFVIVTHYPTAKRAFYTKPDPTDPEFSLSYDVLFRGLEICSGSERINEYQELVDVIKERGMNPDDFEMYLMAFKYGMPTEGGFSYGLERVTKQLLDLKNVRESSLFPRDMERVDIRLSKPKKN